MSNVSATELAQRASQCLEPVYERLGLIRDEVLRVRPPRSPLTEPHLSQLRHLLVEFLGEESAVWGMGFIAAPGVMDGRERYLLWWQRHGDRVARLRLNFDTSSVDVYDYLQMDWYQLALRGQERVAYGPYVDYSGSEMYTITATVPVVADGVFLGVAGADLVVAEVEHRLLAVLRQTPDDAVIVSTERRVISANTPRWLVGSRLSELPSAAASSDRSPYKDVVDLPLGTGWVLAVARPPDPPLDN